MTFRPYWRDRGRRMYRSALQDQVGIMAVSGSAADIQSVEPPGCVAHSVGSLFGKEVFRGFRVVPEPVVVAVPAHFLVAPLLAVDAVGDHRDDPDYDPYCEDPDCCEGDGCHVLRPLTC
jgi:hypothetical protein